MMINGETGKPFSWKCQYKKNKKYYMFKHFELSGLLNSTYNFAEPSTSNIFINMVIVKLCSKTKRNVAKDDI